jgi:hypothetical protein
MSRRWRVGVDSGGTFTDLGLVDALLASAQSVSMGSGGSRAHSPMEASYSVKSS